MPSLACPVLGTNFCGTSSPDSLRGAPFRFTILENGRNVNYTHINCTCFVFSLKGYIWNWWFIRFHLIWMSQHYCMINKANGLNLYRKANCTPCKLIRKFTYGNEQLVRFGTEYVKIFEWKVIMNTCKHANMCPNSLHWNFKDIRWQNLTPSNIEMQVKKILYKSHLRTGPN